MANVIKHKRGSGSDPSASNLVVGELAIRTDTGKLFTKMDSGALAEIAGGGSDIAINTLSSSSGTGGGSATFNDSAYRFTLSSPPSVSAAQLLVSVNGVIQKPVAGTGQPSEGFSVDGNDIIFGDAPATGSDFFILTFRSLGVSVPADNSVTSAKIVDGTIVNADINASAAIDVSKLSGVLPLAGGTLVGNLAITREQPIISFNDSTDNPDYYIGNIDGTFRIRDTTNSSNRLVIDASGRLGINTTNPGANLEVNKGSVGTYLKVGGDNASNGRALTFTSSTGNTGSNGALHTINATSSNGAIALATGSSEALRIDSSGNVGIGTTSPNQLLEVANSSGGATISISTDEQAGSQASKKYNNLDFTGYNNNVMARIQSWDESSNTGHGYLTFFTNKNGVGFTEKLRIDPDGNVGIGTTSPQRLLHQHENSSAANYHVFTNTGTGSSSSDGGIVGIDASENLILWNQENTNLRFATNNNERMRIKSDGTVGIGTTDFTTVGSPNKNFVVGSTTNAQEVATTLNVMEGTNNRRVKFFLDDDDGVFGIDSTASTGVAPFVIRMAQSEKLRMDQSGNVGIGTTNPAVKFVVSNGGAEGLEVSHSSGNVELNAYNRSTSARSPVGIVGQTFTVTTGNPSLNNGLFQDSSGNVGINSDGSGPDRLLHVSDSNNGGAVTPFRLTNINGSSGTEVRMEFECGVDEIAYIGAKNEGSDIGPLIFATATSQAAYPTEKMRIGSNGAINAQGVYDQTTSSGANLNVASDGHIRRSTSSRRYKNTITDATHGLTELLKLKSVTFKGNEDGDTVFGGLIAEDVHNAGLTEFVHYDKDNEPDALAYGNMVALCVKAIQDLNAKVEALEAK